MKVVFRADASERLGAGHVMRCLALGKALAAQGAICSFVCHSLTDHLRNCIEASDFGLHSLRSRTPRKTLHSDWCWEDDAASTAAILERLRPDLLVVDHYQLDHRWQKSVHIEGRRLLVIDDLADRPHVADVLLDHNLGRHPSNYNGLVPPHCKRLIGPGFALLRSEFGETRAEALVSRPSRELRNIMVCLGGGDVTGATLEVVDALNRSTLPPLQITVITSCGGSDELRERAQASPHQFKFLAKVDNMAEAMLEADLAIGAGGGSSWERCCLGLPTLVLSIADNQRFGAQAIEQAGGGIYLGHLHQQAWPARLSRALQNAFAPQALHDLSEGAAMICDGDGALRVVAELMPLKLALRPVRREDSRRVWEWRRAGGATQYYQNTLEVGYAEHDTWFRRAAANPINAFEIIEMSGCPAGYIRLETVSERTGAVSYCLAPEFRGRGFGREGLLLAEQAGQSKGFNLLKASIHPDNVASVRTFEHAGYERESGSTGFLTYAKTLRT